MKNAELSVADQALIDDFLTSKQGEGWSDSMVKRNKKRLAVFCVDFSEDKQIVENEFAKWRKQLEEQGLSSRTINEYVSIASKYVEYTGIAEVKKCSKRELDLTDREFGDLKVLSKIGGGKSPERSFLWKCQCSCGKIVEIPANQLTKGLHTSCGCKKAQRLKDINQYVDGTSLKMVFSDAVRKDNTTGYKGVYLKDNRFAVRIQYKGKRYYLGAYDKLEDAISVRKDAEEKIREEAKLLTYEQ